MLVLCALNAGAQITGIVLDAETGDSIPFATVMYKGHNINAVANINGRYKISRYEGWQLTFSAVGYVPKTITVTTSTRGNVDVKLKPDNKYLKEVTIKSKRQRYSRKNNPAVELMKKVVEHKKLTALETRDYYQYNKYQKITLAMNEINDDTLKS